MVGGRDLGGSVGVWWGEMIWGGGGGGVGVGGVTYQAKLFFNLFVVLIKK